MQADEVIRARTAEKTKAQIKFCERAIRFFIVRKLHSFSEVENAVPSAPTSTDSKSSGHWSSRVWLISAGLFLLWFLLCRHLSGEWWINEQYNYGWFVPFFGLYLLWLRWEDRPVSTPVRDQARDRFRIVMAAIAMVALILLLPVRVFEIGIPDWRPLGWIHAGLVVALTLFLFWMRGGAPWLRHFAFPVGFIFVAVPWITYLEGGTTNHLMRIVASIAAEVLGLFGIPVQLEGNLIRVATGVVGINEACSGVRSLQTSIMIGLLFGELKRLGVLRRVTLLAAAVGIALFANTCRAIFLVYIASREGVTAVERWHDLAGYSILGAVFIGTIAVAAWLGRGRARASSPIGDQVTSSHPPRRLPTSGLMLSLAWILTVEIAAESWYRIHESANFPRIRWTVRWPENEPGFRVVSTAEVRPTLHYDEGRAAAWRQTEKPIASVPAAAFTAPAPAEQIAYMLYFFRWEPGRTTVLRARAHRPDTCLPNLGWKQIHDHGTRRYSSGEITLPFRHIEFARRSGSPAAQFAHAFYCVREDRIRIEPHREKADRERTARAETISEFLRPVREGERERGLQVMQVVLVTGREIGAEAAESRFAEVIQNVVVAAADAK
jgi:exosortase